MYTILPAFRAPKPLPSSPGCSVSFSRARLHRPGDGRNLSYGPPSCGRLYLIHRGKSAPAKTILVDNSACRRLLTRAGFRHRNRLRDDAASRRRIFLKSRRRKGGRSEFANERPQRVMVQSDQRFYLLFALGAARPYVPVHAVVKQQSVVLLIVGRGPNLSVRGLEESFGCCFCQHRLRPDHGAAGAFCSVQGRRVKLVRGDPRQARRLEQLRQRVTAVTIWGYAGAEPECRTQKASGRASSAPLPIWTGDPAFERTDLLSTTNSTAQRRRLPRPDQYALLPEVLLLASWRSCMRCGPPQVGRKRSLGDLEREIACHPLHPRPPRRLRRSGLQGATKYWAQKSGSDSGLLEEVSTKAGTGDLKRRARKFAAMYFRRGERGRVRAATPTLSVPPRSMRSNSSRDRPTGLDRRCRGLLSG